MHQEAIYLLIENLGFPAPFDLGGLPGRSALSCLPVAACAWCDDTGVVEDTEGVRWRCVCTASESGPADCSVVLPVEAGEAGR